MARSGSSGPQGTGLIPGATMAGFGEPPDPEPEESLDETEPEGHDDAGDQQPPADSNPPDPSLIDGLPPASDGGDPDDDDDDDDDDLQARLERHAQELEERIQRRFDRAISRALRNRGQQPADDGGDGGDDGDPPPPPAPRTRRQPSSVDVRTARVLINDAVDEDPELEKAGKAERRAVKKILNRLAPVIDWGAVEDEDRMVEELVREVRSQALDLVKVGSDRKVAQLRNAGLIPQTAGQPGGQPGGRQGLPTTAAMKKGQNVAKRRWPEGKRRLGQ